MTRSDLLLLLLRSFSSLAGRLRAHQTRGPRQRPVQSPSSLSVSRLLCISILDGAERSRSDGSVAGGGGVGVPGGAEPAADGEPAPEQAAAVRAGAEAAARAGVGAEAVGGVRVRGVHHRGDRDGGVPGVGLHAGAGAPVAGHHLLPHQVLGAGRAVAGHGRRRALPPRLPRLQLRRHPSPHLLHHHLRRVQPRTPGRRRRGRGRRRRSGEADRTHFGHQHPAHQQPHVW